MTLSQHFSELAPRIPGVVELISRVPFSWRRGRTYSHHQSKAVEFESWSADTQAQWVLSRMQHLLRHAELKVPFYQRLYAESGFHSSQIKCFDDLQLIPVVTKQMMQSSPLEDRCAGGFTAIRMNTGGTTGQPLVFSAEKKLFGREWAYMHHQWQRRNWKTGGVKLRFAGANLGTKAHVYAPSEGEFLINTYMDLDESCRAVAALVKRYPVRYLHGYPSTVAAFANHAAEHFRNEIVTPLRQNLLGIFLGSEFPVPHYRDAIEQVFSQQAISWYGQTEMTVLAGEKEESYLYHPFQSYGWTEALPRDHGQSCRLVGTNLDGYACPFIRYDTGDLITPASRNGPLLESFRIAEGRVGDTVTDRNGQKISLTSLIFGRHHEVFASINHLQVAQENPGTVLLVISGFPKGSNREADFWLQFDTSGLAMDFKVVFVDSPIKTPAGKVALQVPPESVRHLHASPHAHPSS